MKILKEVGSLIQTLQSNKILKKMAAEKELGAYKTEAEFRSALKEQLVNIAQTQDTPIFSQIFIRPGRAHSEYINKSLESIGYDLEVLFSEINYIFGKIKSHEVFFERVTNELENALRAFDQNLESIKIDINPNNVFNKVVHNSFEDGSKITNILNPIGVELYFDQRRDVNPTTNELALIDTRSGQLTLDKNKNFNIKISNVFINQNETTVSDYDGSSANVSNLLDASASKSWAYDVLKDKPLLSKARLSLGLELGDKQEFNSITLEPNSEVPVFLESITYVNSLDEENTLLIEKGSLNETRTFLFSKIVAKKINVILSQDANKITSIDDKKAVKLQGIINSSAEKTISNPNVLEILNTAIPQERLGRSAYKYSFGLNGVSIGKSAYKEVGVFVSKIESMIKASELALYVKDFTPTMVHWETKNILPSGSIEYSIIKKDFSKNNFLLKSSEYNILPIQTSKVIGERMFFNKKKIQPLRFLAHEKSGDCSNVQLFRNGQLLIRGIDWQFYKRQNLLDPTDFRVQTSETSTIIQLLHTDQQIYNGIYYVDYVPRFISQPNDTVIQDGVKYLANCSTVHPIVVNGQDVARSDVYVKIIIRNNASDSYSTPYIEYYRLACKEE